MPSKAQLRSPEECELVEFAEKALDSADAHMLANETCVSVTIEPAQHHTPPEGDTDHATQLKKGLELEVPCCGLMMHVCNPSSIVKCADRAPTFPWRSKMRRMPSSKMKLLSSGQKR